MASGISFLTWNVAGRVLAAPGQIDVLRERPADVVALQEVRSTTAATWSVALGEAGYPYVEVTLAPGLPDADPARRLGVLVATRHPMVRLASPELPRPERHLATVVDLPGGPVRVHAVHVPTSARSEAVKTRTLDALRAAVADDDGVPAVVAGDLNTPRYESREGDVRSFARTRKGNLRAGFDERHDHAELGVVPGLRDVGFVDVFRAVHGYGARDRSWVYPNGGMGYRLDHLFARGLAPVACAYIHDWRERRLSDHSALYAVLARPGERPEP